MNIFKNFKQFVIGNWIEFKDTRERKQLLLDVASTDKNYLIYETLLHNVQHYLQASDHARGQKANKQFRKIQLKTARKVIDYILPLQDIIGLQPMATPVSLVYKMRYVPAPHTPEYFEEMKNLGPDDIGKRVTLVIISQAVQASTRKLQANWSTETVQALNFQHEFNIEEELSSALGYEIAHEIIMEQLKNLQTLAEQNESFVLEGLSSEQKSEPTAVPFYLDERNLRAVSLTITSAANDIARTARRGPGNVIITSPTGLLSLQLNKFINLRTAPKEEYKNSHMDLQYVADIMSKGTKEGEPEYVMFKVFVSTHFMEKPNETVKCLIAYKGSSAVDTGYILSPYTIVMPSGPAIDPDTYTPHMTMMTRYGTATDDTSKNYFRLVELPSQLAI